MPRPLESSRYPAQAGACELSRWRGGADRCRWCNGAVPPGDEWCGHPCQDEYRRNHWWDHAREAAIVRDGGRCLRCQLGPETITVAKLVIRAFIPMGAVDAARLWRTPQWESLRRSCSLEVNHRVPRRGGGYSAGCHHHLDELETLCHHCHALVTAEQQRLVRTGLADAG